MAKQKKPTYQDYIDEGGGPGLSGIKWNDTGEPVEALGSIGNINLSQKTQAKQIAESPWTRNISDVYGQTDFGDSVYDKEIDSASQLENLEDTRANIQPFIDKLGAGLATFGTKTLTATAGGLGTLFYGLPSAIFRTDGTFNERLRMTYDNDFNKALDGINNSIDDTFKVYMDKSERSGSFYDQTIGSSHFWTKSLLGDGMSFTAGAVLSMYAMGGIGGLLSKAGTLAGETIGQTGRLAKVAEVLKGASSVWTGAEEGAKAIQTANKFAKIGSTFAKAGNLATELVVGSGYESGVEAMDFINQSTTKHKQEYVALHGEPQSPEQQKAYEDDLAQFNKDILPSANALFAGNMVLVGGANMATMPHIFGKGLKSVFADARKLNQVVAGVETAGKVAGETLETAEKGAFRKGLDFTHKITKGAVAEGVREEGGQNAMKNLALDYVNKQYNVDSSKRTFDLVNSVGNALEQAYTTSDGWKEILSGMIIGSLGAPNLSKIGRFEVDESDGKKKFNITKPKDIGSWWGGGIWGEFQEAKEKEELATSIRDKHRKYTADGTMEYMRGNMANNEGSGHLIRGAVFQESASEELDKAKESGDLFTAKNKQNDIIHNYMVSREDSGHGESVEREFISRIEGMDAEAYRAQFGYDEKMTEKELLDRKAETVSAAREQLAGIREIIKNTDRHFQFDLSTEEGRLQREMLIYAQSTIGSVNKRSESMKSDILETFKDHLGVYKHDDAKFDNLIEADKQTIENAKAEKIAHPEKSDELDKIIAETENRITEVSASKMLSKAHGEFQGTPKIGNTVSSVEFAKSAIESNLKFKKQTKEEKDSGAPKELDDAVYGPDSIKMQEALDSFKDLSRLARRNEEALELYATTKSPRAFNNFWRTERIQNQIRESQKEAAKLIADSITKEDDEASTHLDHSEDPKAASEDTGVSKERTFTMANDKSVKKLKAVQIRETAALEHINRIEALRNNLANVKFGENDTVEIDGTKYSINYKNGKIDSISEIDNPRVKIRNPLLLNRIKSKQLSDSFNTEEVSNEVYEQAKEENPELVDIESIYKNLITDKIAQSMYDLYNSKKLTLKDIQTLRNWVAKSRSEISTLLNNNGDSEIINNALDNLDLIEMMINDKHKETNERQVNQAPSNAKSIKRQAIESQQEEDYWAKQELANKKAQEFQSIDEVEAYIEEVMSDSNHTEEELQEVEDLQEILDDSLNSVEDAGKNIKPVEIDPKSVEVITQVEPELLADNTTSPISSNEYLPQVIDSGQLQIQDDLDSDDEYNDEDDKNTFGKLLVQAWNKIAYKARESVKMVINGKTEHVEGKFNPKFSTISDYSKFKEGSNIEFKIEPTNEFGSDNLGMVPIAIYHNGNVIGHLHDISYMQEGRVASRSIDLNQQSLLALRAHIIKNSGFKTKVSKISNGHLIKSEKNQIQPFNEAFGDKSIYVTVTHNDTILGIEKTGIKHEDVINGKNLKQTINNKIVALLKVKDKLIAVPLLANKLNSGQSQTISKVIDLFVRNITGELSDKERQEFNDLAASINSKMSIKKNGANQEIFDIKTIAGLRNFVSLFTYARQFTKGEINTDGLGLDHLVFGIDQASDSDGDKFTTISWGKKGNITSVKISKPKGGTKYIASFKFAGQESYSNVAGGKSNLKTSDIPFDGSESLYEELNNHFNQSYFYSNIGLVGQKLSMPTISEDNSIEFEDSKDYGEILKDNVSTNLIDMNIGTQEEPKFIHTVQPNITFDTSEVGKKEAIESPKLNKETIKEQVVITQSEKSVYDALDNLEKVGDKIDNIVDKNGNEGSIVVSKDGLIFKSGGNKDEVISQEDISKKFIDSYFKFKTSIQSESNEDLNLRPTEDEPTLDIDVTSFSFSPEVAGFESEIKPIEEKTYNLGTDIAGQMRKSSEIARNQLKEDIESKELKPNCK